MTHSQKRGRTRNQTSNRNQTSTRKESDTKNLSEKVPTNRYVVFFSLAIFGCLADLTTKHWIFQRLGMPYERPVWWIVDDLFGFQTSLNEGALFGMGQGLVWLFALLSVVAVIGIFWWLFVCRAATDWLITVALGCMTAGIFGNLYDRVGFSGLRWNYANSLHAIGDPVYAVRDWILVIIIQWPWPTFNIADSLLVCGGLMLAWHAFFHTQSE